MLEPSAARMAATRCDPHGVARLGAAADHEAALIEDPSRFATASSRFHDTLMEESGNKTLAVLHLTITEIVATTTSHVVARADGAAQAATTELAVRSHRRLVDLVAARDADGAERFWSRHMEIVRQRFSDVYGMTTVVDLLG